MWYESGKIHNGTGVALPLTCYYLSNRLDEVTWWVASFRYEAEQCEPIGYGNSLVMK